MAVEVRQKKINYRRAHFSLDVSDGHTLEKSVVAAFGSLSTIEARRVSLPDGHVIDCLRFKKRASGHFVHLAVYTPGERASVVPVLGSVTEGDISAVRAPAKHDFMDGDVMLLLAGNDILICASSVHDGKITAYFATLFAAAGLDESKHIFSAERVANADKVQLIEDEGVKEIALNATMFEASLDRAKRTSHRQKLTGALIDEFMAIFSKDKSLKDIADRENITAEVILKFDQRRKGGEVGGKRLSALSREVVDQSTDGYRITTLEGNVINGAELSLSKQVEIAAHGKSVQWAPAAAALDAYYKELRADGSLEK